MIRQNVLVYTLAVAAVVGVNVGYYKYYSSYKVVQPQPNNVFTERCDYDTKDLCPACFSEPPNCSIFAGHLSFVGEIDDTIAQFNRHRIRIGLLGDTPEAVYNNLNRDSAIENLRESICEELSDVDDCSWRNEEEFIDVLWQKVLLQDRFDGARFCPSSDEGGLTRFVEKFEQTKLLTLILMLTNSQSLMVELLSQHDLPVPSLVFQRGFILVEAYGGNPLTTYYLHPFKLRLKIAYELINAIIELNTEVDSFRFFFPGIGPQNIFVNLLPNEEVNVTFTELENVIIIDDRKDIALQIQYGNVNTTDCIDRYGDIHLHSVCQLLLENALGEANKGFLHYHSLEVKGLKRLNAMLDHCVYCDSHYCEDRETILRQIQMLLTIIKP